MYLLRKHNLNIPFLCAIAQTHIEPTNSSHIELPAVMNSASSLCFQGTQYFLWAGNTTLISLFSAPSAKVSPLMSPPAPIIPRGSGGGRLAGRPAGHYPPARLKRRREGLELCSLRCPIDSESSSWLACGAVTFVYLWGRVQFVRVSSWPWVSSRAEGAALGLRSFLWLCVCCCCLVVIVGCCFCSSYCCCWLLMFFLCCCCWWW